MKDILIFIVVLLVAYGAGKTILNLFIKRTENVSEDIIFASGLGLALLGYVVYAIGSLGFLYQKYVLAAFLLCGAIAIRPVYELLKGLKLSAMLSKVAGLGRSERFLAAVAVFIPVICLFGAMAPEIGNDSLSYHLQHPKIFVQDHRIGFIPYARESLWPYLTQMLFTAGLLFKSVTIAKLFHYFFGILSILSVFSLTRKFFSRKEALLAAALFASAPGIFTQMTYAYVDLAQGFYSFAALYAMLLWQDREDIKLLILSGVFLGIALSVKLLSGMSMAALLLIMLLAGFHKKISFRTGARQLFIFCVFAFFAGCVWYIRSYVVLGNPVYPFLHNIFGSGWETNLNFDVGTRKDLIGFLLLPWDVVMHADSFGGEQIGVTFLAFFPFLFFLPWQKRNVQYLFLFFVSFAVVWFVSDPMLRYTFVNFAVVFILISVGFYRALEVYKLHFLRVLLICCISLNVLLSGYHNFGAAMLAFGRMTPQEYLMGKERTYPVAEYVNNNTPSNSVIIMAGEPRGFYFDRKVIYYHVWVRQSKVDIALYLNELRATSTPIYLICRDDADHHVFDPMIAGKKPLFSATREVDRGKNAVYTIFQL